MNCPICLCPLNARTKPVGKTQEGALVIDFAVSTPEHGVEGKLVTLQQALLGYWRWVAEGNPVHGPVRDGQYFYDPYHEFIEYVPSEKHYKFCIQTFDSPDGDTWWRGTFRYETSTGIKILSESDESR